MARIRTIKPEFFTSEDICALSPLARLLYIGTWLEADRDGRLEWNPKTLKKRYFPDQQLDIDALCDELTTQGVVVLYGDGLACIPTFTEHQVINPREAKSKLRPPTEEELHACTHASGRVQHAPSLPSPSIPFRSGTAIMSPAEYAKKLEFCAFVGSRLEVTHALHRELVKLTGGQNPEGDLKVWYLSLNDQLEETQEAIKPNVYKWLKAKHEAWLMARGNGGKDYMAETIAQLEAEAAAKGKP